MEVREHIIALTRTPGMVSELSATGDASTIRRRPPARGLMALSCNACDSIPVEKARHASQHTHTASASTSVWVRLVRRAAKASRDGVKWRVWRVCFVCDDSTHPQTRADRSGGESRERKTF